MTAVRLGSILLTLACAGSVYAEELDGSQPLECTATQGHDCLPADAVCTRLKPQAEQAPVFGIAFAKQEIRSPYRTSLLKVTHATINAESLVLQGADLLFAWSALINKTTGAFTISVADRKGA